MNDEVQKAYDYLTPADQLIIDSLITALFARDMQIRNLVKALENEIRREDDQ